ncbi:maltokinase N-terminal cap-like domain-containing protein [Propionibacteriaceae bacterium G1746]|uniref:maltokinase N-terminal cap-like domain-containing protein n=1 Tax=Aestuariimicrobium sp. G57 TaxID=3418485 RepID=UPI003C1ABEAF
MTNPIPAVWAYVTGARWFAGKGRGAEPGTVRRLTWCTLTDDLAVRLELVGAHYPDGTEELYLVPLSYRRQPLDAQQAPGAFFGTLGDDEAAALLPADRRSLVHLHDALRDPGALRALVDMLATGRRTEDWSATVVRPVDLTGEARAFGGEQSNTSVLVGTTAITKFFRRLEPGANLDISVHDALNRAGVGSVATLHGWLEARVERVHYDLAMVLEQLPQARDGWLIATGAARTGADFTGDAAALGAALASIHLALCDTFPVTQLRAADISATMRRRLAGAAAEVPALAELAPALDDRFAALADEQVPGQRIHGDFHLGQTLLTAAGWSIIDFEGEPIKSLAERQLPDSRWRDAAGMLRSLAYATSACDDPASSRARDWLTSAGDAFLDAYNAGFGGRFGERDRALLDAYVADKAIYEVVYESRNRPDWIEIPLSALRALVG